MNVKIPLIVKMLKMYYVLYLWYCPYKMNAHSQRGLISLHKIFFCLHYR
jgi:hypothetical protein